MRSEKAKYKQLSVVLSVIITFVDKNSRKTQLSTKAVDNCVS